MANNIQNQVPVSFPGINGPVFVIWGKVCKLLSGIAIQFAEENNSIEKLNLVIESYGGCAHQAFSTIVALRNCSQKITAYIPQKAKSAATLMCLGADEIVFSFGAQIGPLDAQVPDPRNTEMGKKKYLSALNMFKSMDTITDYLNKKLQNFLVEYMHLTKCSIEAVFPLAREYLELISNPIFEQIHPLDLGMFQRALNTCEQYGVQLLRRYKVVESKDARRIAHHLVTKYPDHAYRIGLDAAKQIGLSCRPTNSQETDTIKHIYNALTEKIGPIENRGSEYYGTLI